MTRPYASYEQQVESRIIRESHIIRIRMGETKASIIDSLSNVPEWATVHMILSDEDTRSPSIEGWPAHGVIHFDYERDE